MAEKNKNNNSLVFADDGYLSYIDFNKLSFADKLRRRLNIAKAQFDNGSLAKAGYALVGGYDPENPRLSTGDVPNPGMRNPTEIVNTALLSIKLMETINNYWKNLGRLKIRLGGNGKYASGILTKPGTAPTTFNGLNINYITSPKGGNVTHKFYTDLGSEYILTKDGFARRIKSPHSNVEGSDSGLHDWNEGTTIFTKGEDGKLFNTAFYKFSDFGFKPGTYGLVKQNGKAKIMLIDPKTKLWREAMFSDAYPTSVKLGLLLDRVLSVDYSDVPFVGGHILEKTSGSWHPGSSVAFIEGLKQGGKMNILEFLKNGSGIHIKEKNKGKFTSYCGGKVTDECILKGKNSSNPAIRKRATFAANARKWKHKDGGIIKAEKGTIFGKIGNFFKNNELGLSILSTGINLGLNSLTNSANKNVISNEAEISKANVEKNAANEKLNNLARAEEMTRNTLTLLYDKDNPNAFEGEIVKGQLKLKFLNLLNAPIDQELAALKALIDFLASQLKNLYSGMDYLGGLSTDILNAFSRSNSSNNSSNSNSYFGNHVNTLYKNYGTFNSDGSMNLGGELGTFSTTGGYKPRQYQMKTYTPLLKFSV